GAVPDIGHNPLGVAWNLFVRTIKIPIICNLAQRVFCVRTSESHSLGTGEADSKAVVDLHTAGLHVAEGMLAARDLGLSGQACRTYLESNYPALSLEDERYW
ncbi:MAG: hypothetical protein RLO04_11130, partial [Limnobacter sp.]|uniref:hypothetical protein n=1 Tax=Limnobacter sp. TaxID=2003368 RepID=UPI0032EC6D77